MIRVHSMVQKLFPVPSVDEMKKIPAPCSHQGSLSFPHVECWFFVYWSTGETVAYVSTYRYENKIVDHLLLCDIEVKEEYRGIGYACEALSVLAWDQKMSIGHEGGGYTPDGVNRIAQYFHTKPWRIVAEFSPITFVKD